MKKAGEKLREEMAQDRWAKDKPRRNLPDNARLPDLAEQDGKQARDQDNKAKLQEQGQQNRFDRSALTVFDRCE
jgi:hypothetical protein